MIVLRYISNETIEYLECSLMLNINYLVEDRKHDIVHDIENVYVHGQ